MPSGARQLIINADDLGYDPAVSDGILRSMREGLVTSTTLMVNGPFSAEAADRAKDLPVGLHLNLARWRSLSGAVSGEFVEARASELPPDAVRAEALAQLDELQRLLGKPATHVDVHKHLHRLPNVMEGLVAAALERRLPVRSIDAAMRERLASRGVRTNPHFIGDAGAEAYWTLERLRAELEDLPEGVTELMCHPGYAPTQVRSGYSQQREVELRAFLHPDARAIIERLNIQLVDFRAL